MSLYNGNLIIYYIQIIMMCTLLYFTYNVELIKDCDCKYEEWHQQYLKYFALFTLLIIVPFSYNYQNLIMSKNYKLVWNIVNIAATLLMVYTLFEFTRKLNEKDCECLVKGREIQHKFLYMYSHLIVIIIALSVIVTCVGALQDILFKK